MKKKRDVNLLIIIVLFLPLIFGMSPVETEQANGKTEQSRIETKQVAGETEPPEKFRDPFKSPFSAELLKTPQAPSLPIYNYSLSEFKLVGIIWGELGRVAVVEAPDRKCYLVKKGERIGRLRGKVTEVGTDHFEVQTSVTDYLGKTKTEEVTVKLHSTEDEPQLITSR
ncbi:MAG: pilus assembly protein PilP [bacterium]